MTKETKKTVIQKMCYVVAIKLTDYEANHMLSDYTLKDCVVSDPHDKTKHFALKCVIPDFPYTPKPGYNLNTRNVVTFFEKAYKIDANGNIIPHEDTGHLFSELMDLNSACIVDEIMMPFSVEEDGRFIMCKTNIEDSDLNRGIIEMHERIKGVCGDNPPSKSIVNTDNNSHLYNAIRAAVQIAYDESNNLTMEYVYDSLSRTYTAKLVHVREVSFESIYRYFSYQLNKPIVQFEDITKDDIIKLFLNNGIFNTNSSSSGMSKRIKYNVNVSISDTYQLNISLVLRDVMGITDSHASFSSNFIKASIRVKPYRSSNTYEYAILGESDCLVER